MPIATLRKLLSPLALALVAASAACAPAAGEDDADHDSSELVEGAAMPDAAKAMWQAYVTRATSGVSLQAGCEPRRFEPGPGVRQRGVVVMFHGFTACPQQFFDMGADLAAAGFDVLVPLLPGHGRTPRFEGGKRIDDMSALPTVDTRRAYADLAKEMTAIARSARGTRVVAGLSMGGMVATSALEQGAGVWSRGLLFAPFFGPPGAAGWATRIGGTLAGGIERSWGPECVAETNSGHRAGICSFTLGNLEAGRRLGDELIRNAAAIEVPLQVVGVEADHAADNGRTAALLDGVGGPKEACFYAKGMPHAFTSKVDHPELDHAWLPALHRGVTAFVRDGKPFTTSGLSREHGYFLCAPR